MIRVGEYDMIGYNGYKLDLKFLNFSELLHPQLGEIFLFVANLP
jgi:hypothetical protein